MTIEKYEGSFSKDEIGVTQIPNKTIQLLCKNAEALAMYVFILSLPASWNLHYKHLMREMDMSKDKVYQCLNLLKCFGLLSTTEIREQGRFVRNHYQVHLRPRPPVTETTEKVTSPFPCLPEAAKPDPVNPEAYKTKTLEIKESKKTNTISNLEKDRSLKADSLDSLDSIQAASVKAVSRLFHSEDASMKNTLLTKIDAEIREVVQSYGRQGKTIQNYEAFAMAHAKKIKEARELGECFHDVAPSAPAMKRKDHRAAEYEETAPRPADFVRSAPIPRNPELSRSYMSQIYRMV